MVKGNLLISCVYELPHPVGPVQDLLHFHPTVRVQIKRVESLLQPGDHLWDLKAFSGNVEGVLCR